MIIFQIGFVGHFPIKVPPDLEPLPSSSSVRGPPLATASMHKPIPLQFSKWPLTVSWLYRIIFFDRPMFFFVEIFSEMTDSRLVPHPHPPPTPCEEPSTTAHRTANALLLIIEEGEPIANVSYHLKRTAWGLQRSRQYWCSVLLGR